MGIACALYSLKHQHQLLHKYETIGQLTTTARIGYRAATSVLLSESDNMASAVAKLPAVLKHYNVPAAVPNESFKAKCKYCPKEIVGSVKATTNNYWWKHFVRSRENLASSNLLTCV